MTLPLWAGILIFAAGALVAGAGPAVMLVIARARGEARYKVAVPGYGLRLTSAPPFKSSVDDVVVYLNRLIAAWAEYRNVDREALRTKISGLRVSWVPGEERDGRRVRAFTDSYGRLIAGDHAGDRVRVAYLDDDIIATTAFGHEVAHELIELSDPYADPEHRHSDLWKIVETVDGEMRREATGHDAG